MIKQLLSVAIMGGFALSAAASVPCPLKHNTNWNPAAGPDWCDGNGFWYEPSSSSSAAEASDPDYVFNCHWSDKSAYSYLPEVGFQWQTASIKATTDDLKITKNHVVIAWDYKTNHTIYEMSLYFIYGGEIKGFVTNPGVHFSPSDEWQTTYIYAPLNKRPEDFGIFEDPNHTGSDYLFVRAETLLPGNPANQDLSMDIKLPRWLTIEEAEAELAAKNLTGDQEVQVVGAANTDFTTDKTEDGLTTYYVTAGENPLINLGNPCTGINDGNTVLKGEYQVVFGDEAEEHAFTLWPMSNIVDYAQANIQPVAIPMSAEYVVDEDEWGEISYDFGDEIKESNFNNPRVRSSGLWMNFRPDAGFPEGSMMVFRNFRWTSNGTSGIENITGDDANAPAVYYNLQGVQVANPANGLYIKKQGNTTTKVLVK